MEQIEDIQHLRTGDHLTLIAQMKCPVTVPTINGGLLASGGLGIHGGRLSIAGGALGMSSMVSSEPLLELIRVSLAADGFGTHLCHLENLSNHDVPGDIVSSTFLCENALSKKALQEQLLLDSSASHIAKSSPVIGYKTLLYGHAVCFKHVQSEKYLACMSSSPPTDKLAFEIGLLENTVERAWWIIEPSNKQRCEGDKVRVGDEVILISVSSERYMHAALPIFSPLASFQPSCWAMGVVKRGDIDTNTMGYVKGGDTIRFQKGLDECLSVVPVMQRAPKTPPLTYEFGDGRWEGRSIWRIEFVRSKWNASCLQWGQPIRIRHVVTGRYLLVKDNMSLSLCEASSASCSATLFAFYPSKEAEEIVWDLVQEPNQGQPCFKYNENNVFLKHVSSQTWLSYLVIDSKVPGKFSGKRVVMLCDGHSDDGFVLRMSQYEESMASSFIMKAMKFFNRFIVALKSLTPVNSDEDIWSICSKDIVSQLIKDLIAYFSPPSDDLDHEEKQLVLKNLNIRQDLFQAEGLIIVIKEMIDSLKEYTTHFSRSTSTAPVANTRADDTASPSNQTAHVSLEDLQELDEICSLLFELLASAIRGNRVNCSKFSEPASLDWLMTSLHMANQQDALGVLHCLLQSSPEAVNIFTETHIKILLTMIEKFGKDHRVLDVMRVLCVTETEAVRANQNCFLEYFSNKQSNYAFQTKIVDQIVNVGANVFIGLEPGSAMYYKWYFEVHVENILRYPNTHLRIGWASTCGFRPYPTRGGPNWNANGVGDDMFSWGFDGKNFWTDGRCYPIQGARGLFQYDDVIGCCIDFTIPRISFTLNGIPVLGVIESFPIFDGGLFHPVASMSSLIQVRFVLGGKHGVFSYKPPEGYTPACELMTQQSQELNASICEMDHCLNMSTQSASEPPNQHSIILHGPCQLPTVTAFHPQPVDLGKVTLSDSVLELRLKMAESFHEQWSITKIEAGWIYGEYGIDEVRRYHDCLKPFRRLNEDQQYVELMTADEILKTIIALGYSIKVIPQLKGAPPPKRVNLPNNYALSNGYKPAPFDISVVQLGPVMSKLVELLAENTHNIWAEAKIARGWTYGTTENPSMKRTPLLTEYQSLDSVAKRGVRNAAVESIKLIVVLGYKIEPPIVDISENALIRKHVTIPKFRVFRADYTRCASSGKLYYEFEAVTQGHMLVGWARKGISPYRLPSCDVNAFLFNGIKGEKQNEKNEKFGKKWKSGDVIGCFIDLEEKSIGFSLNGEMMMDLSGRESAFDHFDIGEGMVPVFCLGRGERAKVNFGNQPNSLRFYFTNGYHQGYVPLCFDMKRPLPLWASIKAKQFKNIDQLEKSPLKSVKTTSAEGNAYPAVKIVYNNVLSDRNKSGQFLRLSLPLTVTGVFPARPSFLCEMEMLASASAGGKRTNYGGGQSSQTGGGVIIEEGEESEDPELNRPPIEYSKIRKTDQSFLDSYQATTAKVLQPILKNISHSDDEDSEDELCVIGFADEKLKKIAAANAAAQYKEETPGQRYKQSTSVAPYNQVKTTSTSSKHVKKFEELFNFEKYGSTYQYSIRIYQGQETSSMFIGWSCSNFCGRGLDGCSGKGNTRDITDSITRNVKIKVFDNNGEANACGRKSLYVANVSDLCSEVSPQSPPGTADNVCSNPITGLQIDVLLDVATGLVSFIINKRFCNTTFQAEVGQSLFPCVYFKPTCKDGIQFEMTRSMNGLPLSCFWLTQDLNTSFYPVCPPRLTVQVNDTASWLLLPDQTFQAKFINSQDKGWRVLTDIPRKFCSLLDSESGTCHDILELTERKDWMEYHCKTLQLYAAMCDKGNHKAAHKLTEIIDEKQLLFLIQCEGLPGELRLEYFNILIAVHFQHQTSALLATSGEFIFALSSDEVYSIPNIKSQQVSVDLSKMQLPHFVTPQIEAVLSMSDAPKNFNYAKLGPPKINTEELKRIILKALENALPYYTEGTMCRQQDPPGGSYSYHIVPCLKLINCLLINGLLNVAEMQKLVTILDPTLLKKENDEDNSDSKDKNSDQKDGGEEKLGLLQMQLDEMAKIEIINLIKFLKTNEMKQIMSQLIIFANSFVGEIQYDQKRRYGEIMTNSENEQPSVLAWKTKEFRCNTLEQMKSMLNFRNEKQPFAPCRKDLQTLLNTFHASLREQLGIEEDSSKDGENADKEITSPPVYQRLFESLKLWVAKKFNKHEEEVVEMVLKGTTFREKIVSILIKWAKDGEITDNSLTENLFLLLFTQHDEINQLIRGLEKTYVIGTESEANARKFLTSLCVTRQLIDVAMGPDEEKAMVDAINDMTFNTIFYQHPGLIRKLSAHESVMTVMVNIMSASISSAQSAESTEDYSLNLNFSSRRKSTVSLATAVSVGNNPSTGKNSEWNLEMVAACCRFLSFFCRTSSSNQKAMFEHLDFLLENITMGLAYPSLHGSTPLDVAAASIHNNGELALALRQHQLESVIKCLCDCGLASNSLLLQRGVEDIGWDPVVGERLLSFLKTTVWVNGESVQQNAFQILRMIVRRPECLGPALRAGAKGLLDAVMEAIELQKSQNAIHYASSNTGMLVGGKDGVGGMDYGEADRSSASWVGDDHSMVTFGGAGADSASIKKGLIRNATITSNMNYVEPNIDDVQIGDAVLNFYAALIDLLACCSPNEEENAHEHNLNVKNIDGGAEGGGNDGDEENEAASYGENQRVRSILQSLVPMDDLQGILGMQFTLPSVEMLQQKPQQAKQQTEQQKTNTNADQKKSEQESSATSNTPAVVDQNVDQNATNPPTKMTTLTANSYWVGPLKPQHKAAIVKFLDRVYGIEDSETLMQLIAVGFLPDLRVATLLDTESIAGHEFCLSLNRYLCQTVFPLLTKNVHLFGYTTESENVVETLLLTVFRFYRCRTLSNAQKKVVNSFFSCVIQHVRPPTIQKFLAILSQQLFTLEPHTEIAYDALDVFFQLHKDYYSGIDSKYGNVSDRERAFLMRMFESLFDALVKCHDAKIVQKALPALVSLVCTIPPDYLHERKDNTTITDRKKPSVDPQTGQYNPQGANSISSVYISKELSQFTLQFAEQIHDQWAKEMFSSGWSYGQMKSEEDRKSVMLKPYKLLSDYEQDEYKYSIKQKLRIVLSLGYEVSNKPYTTDDSENSSPVPPPRNYQNQQNYYYSSSDQRYKLSMQNNSAANQQPQPTVAGYKPNPVDLSSVTLSSELNDLANAVGECCHDFTNYSILNDPQKRSCPVEHTFVPYELLTDEEKEKDWKASHDFIKFLIVSGFEIFRSKQSEVDDDSSSGIMKQKRFSLLLLQKVMINADRAAKALKDHKSALIAESPHRKVGTMGSIPDITKMFSLVVVPLVHKYVSLHRDYYIRTKEEANSKMESSDLHNYNPFSYYFASVKEKELMVGLFCRLFAMLKDKHVDSSGMISVGTNSPYNKCIKAVANSLEFSAIASSSNSTVLGLVHIFFLSVVNELKSLQDQLLSGNMDHISSHTSSFKGAKDLKFVIITLLPVLTIILRRIGAQDMYGQSLIVEETQFCCYQLLEHLYLLAADERVCRTKSPINFGLSYIRKQRGVIGDCLAEFAKAFPVAFLEPHLAVYNKQSILNNKLFKQRFEGLCVDVPTLEEILNEVHIMANENEQCYDPLLVIEVLLPMACTYLSTWVYKGPDYELVDAVNYPTNVTHEQVNCLLANVLTLITNNFGNVDSVWMTKVARVTYPIWRGDANASMLSTSYLPAVRVLSSKMNELIGEEQNLKNEWQSGKDTTTVENDLEKGMILLVRDIYAFFPFLLTFMDQQRCTWTTEMPPEAYELFELITDIFAQWSKSQTFRREELNFVVNNNIDTLAYIGGATPDTSLSNNTLSALEPANDIFTDGKKKNKKKKKAIEVFQTSMSLIMVACKRMIPVGLCYLSCEIQEIIQSAKQKFLQKSVDEEVLTSIQSSIDEYKNDKSSANNVHLKEAFEFFPAPKVLHIAKVLQRLHFVDHPALEKKKNETRLLSKARKRSVMQCFKMAPLYSMQRHQAINNFIIAYQENWLEKEEQNKDSLIELLTEEREESHKAVSEDSKGMDPLTQVVAFIKKAAQSIESEQTTLPCEFLYISYAQMMSKSCSCEEDEDDDGNEQEQEPSFEEQEMAKQKLLSDQSRLKERGAAEMILLLITKCNGIQSEVAEVTLQLGIAVLAGGNVDVQTTMLNFLVEKKNVAFFNSIAGFMQSCSVLNLDSFERCNKAEDQGSVTSTSTSEATSNSRVMSDSSFTTKLFRFLQLLCEGHNADWQNYLRLQEGNISSVNLINASVDYLVRLQESMSDFFWHYSSSDEIDTRGREAFMVAILVGKQVFASLTEMIQGPCIDNQLALTHSRLWDAVSGFFHIFANLQLKLSQDPEQMEFLRELMDLQKEMVTLLLSMLEGNVLNGPIGKQMVDTLALCSQNVEQILQFFTTFLKYSEIVAGVSFKDYDLNGDGIIQPSEFRKVLKSQKVYSEEQMNFLLECADKDSDGRISYKEFSERFSDPASEIGFNIALLFTNLSEHTTNDARLEKMVEVATDLIDIFESQLGRIEILGGTKRIERVYFEISEENKSSWEAETIKESKREFLYSGVVGMADMEKLDTFVNFCEDTIYEMQHTRSLYPDDTDPSLPTTRREKWTTKLIRNIWSFFKFITSPWNIMMLLLKMILFFIFKLPLIVCIKIPYIIIAYILRAPFGMVASIIKGTIFGIISIPRWLWNWKTGRGKKLSFSLTENDLINLGIFHLINKNKNNNALDNNTVLTPSTVDSVPTALNSPLPDLVIEGETAANTLTPGGGGDNNNTSDEQFNFESEMEDMGIEMSGEKGHNKTLTDSQNKTASLTKAESRYPVFMRLYDYWWKTRKDTVEFDYSNTSMSCEDTDEQSDGKSKASKKSYSAIIMCMLARNYYRVKTSGAILSLIINVILLFCRISVYVPPSDAGAPNDVFDEHLCGGSGGEDYCEQAMASTSGHGEPIEIVTMDEDMAFLEPVLAILSILHAFISLLILLAYYKLKVPLVIFQREKEVSRKLEFDGLYLTKQPEWNDFREKLDSVVISSKSFPVNFWDKFVKKRAKSKYSETVGEEEIDAILGTASGPQDDNNNNSSSSNNSNSNNAQSSNANSLFGDVRYNIWQFGVVFSDQAFLYIFFYFLFSIAGNFSRFFFAIHLMDIAFGNKDLSAILKSVTHNGKQLVLTAMLTAIVIYLYTVIAFNFFRNSYVEQDAEPEIESAGAMEHVIANGLAGMAAAAAAASSASGMGVSAAAPGFDGEGDGGGDGNDLELEEQKCGNMWQCFIFHLHHGLRAGGGIGDEIEDPDGQEYMYWRIIFDMTFFFFVIVILLAIIQGLIIDAFGELRGQLEQTKEDLETKCFICGMGKEYFDEQAAHGFEIHTEKEHNFANYMFFLMYLINKDETEYTGQETYVWNLYQERNFDFFPLGDCFRKQYEEELKN